MSYQIKDSGIREKFETGSVRDTEEGKGRFDLFPYEAMHRVACHYQNGAKKYEPRNWEKGQKFSRLVSSMIRHAFRYLAGHKDEDHLAAVAWNSFALMTLEERIKNGEADPKLNDLPPIHKYGLEPDKLAPQEEIDWSIVKALDGVPLGLSTHRPENPGVEVKCQLSKSEAKVLSLVDVQASSAVMNSQTVDEMIRNCIPASATKIREIWNKGLMDLDITHEVAAEIRKGEDLVNRVISRVNKPMPLLYVAGKHRDSRGAYYEEQNTREAEEVAHILWSWGYAVICPHSLFRYLEGGLDPEQMGAGCLVQIQKCDCVIVMPNWMESQGTHIEIKFAEQNGIPLYFWNLKSSKEDLAWFLKSRAKKSYISLGPGLPSEL